MLHISEIMFCVFAAKTFHRGKPSVFHISEIIFCVYAAKTIQRQTQQVIWKRERGSR